MKWIKLSEQLPDVSGTYLIASPSYNIPMSMYFSVSNTEWSWDDVDYALLYDIPEITHWMELPKLPEEKS